MKNIKLMIFTFACMFMLITGVSATTKSGNFFDCSGASAQCVTCTYKEMTYYVKADGKGSGEVAWKTDAKTTGAYGGAKSSSVNFSDFCQAGCKKLQCLQNVYISSDSKGTSIYSVKEPTAGYYGSVDLSDSDDNGKPFIAEETQKEIEEGKKYSPRTCKYYSYSAVQGSSTMKKSSSKNFVVSMDADGNFKLQYGGVNVSNASTLVGTGNLTPDKFVDGCPEIYVSCPVQKNGEYICSASDTDFYYGEQDGSGSEPGNGSDERELTDGAETSSSFLEICDEQNSPQTLAAFRFVGKLITLAKIIVPIILIVMGMIDLSKAVVSGKDSAVKDAAFTFGKRALIAIIIFVAPTLVFGFFDMVSGWAGVKKKYDMCIKCLNDDSSCPEITIVNSK